MNTAPAVAQKKRVGRKYQFDPQAASANYTLVADQVRDIVLRDRADLKSRNGPKRETRRALFRRLADVRRDFVLPESKDESDTRVLSLNSQIVLKSELSSALTSLLCTIEGVQAAMVEPERGDFTADPSTTEDEQLQEHKALQALRDMRASKFLAELMEQSRAELAARQQRLEEVLRERRERDAGEAREEDATLLASDRKLLASGVYRVPYKLNPP